MRRRTNHRGGRLVIPLAFGGGVAVLAWQVWPDEPPAPRDANTPGVKGDANTAAPGDANAPGPASRASDDANGEVLKLQSLTAAVATKLVAKGNKLLADKKRAEGRAELSRALLSGALPSPAAQTVRKTLTDLADKMILSAKIFDGDPYALQYTFRSGEVLQNVERKLRLHVPPQILLKINRISSARDIRAGQTLKMLLGPFHAIVDKSDFTMDLYLHRAGEAPAFVRRLRVGLGKNGSTPAGLWRVALGKKLIRAPWNPPPNAVEKRRILWGQEGYPLGKMGYWLGLDGIDENIQMHTGYGIHGTNVPESIGNAESLGCIRLADEDIELVFFLLYEKWSTVRVRS